MSAHEVKNCPFCGVTPPIPVGTRGVSRKHYAVRCGTDNCYGNPLTPKTYATQEEAIAAWNRRAQPAEEVQPVAWRYKVVNGYSFHAEKLDHYHSENGKFVKGEPLYTRPPAADADRLDAERYRWLRDESWAGYNISKGKPRVFETVTMVLDGAKNFKTILAEEALDAAIDAALAASKEQKDDDRR